jgi:hypothetical protein
MSQIASQDNKEKILSAFKQLMAEYQKNESKVETKEEEAEKEKNEQLLVKTAAYTVDNIVNGMAVLQLDFGTIINELADKLVLESEKLEEFKKAIGVENQKLVELRQVRLVADALYILRQEHQEELRILEEKIQTQQEAIEKEIAKTRKNWEQESTEFEVKTNEERETIAKQREQKAADDLYEIERVRKLETDRYEETKRLQERELSELERDKQKDWSEREKILAEKQTEFGENTKKIEGHEEKLKQDYNKAKEEAIKEAERQAKIKFDLFEKEWEANKQGCELKIQSLEATIQRNAEQIAELTDRLQTVTTQAQNLAMKAFQSNNN